ncbi:MAG TPA: tetraacyldisaccharide 4'-kinase [Candidatus Cybelea sp.]|nr:tetraacyldisaccharide 4'-kinase [Candidatus Cybelea sp.]
MRAPEFWHSGTQSLWPGLLEPVSHVWIAAGHWRQRHAHPYRSPVPVVCVGNLVAGGAGKTPTAIEVARRLLRHGRQPHLVTRGYGGKLHGPLRVEPQRHTARLVGDETLLLAEVAPTWVARDRASGVRAAAEAGADAVVLDDGHQNFTVQKDLSLVVIDAAYGHGNGRVIPAGPLREPAADGLARADGVVLIGDGPPEDGLLPARRDLPILRARLAAGANGSSLAGRRVLAFAGIGQPEKFFRTLKELGCTLALAHGFPDHHVYAPDEIMRLVEAAQGAGAIPVTTAKDWVRLSDEARAMIHKLDVALRFEDDGRLDELLARVIRG